MIIEHLAIWVKDLEDMKSFYQKYFGARANRGYFNKDKGFSSYFLSFQSGTRLEIMHMATIPDSKNDPIKQAIGLIHLAFSVGSIEKVNSLTQRLKTNGFKVLDGPRKTGDGYYESAVLDPENNRIEITI
ncbi:MAG: glyoxalase [Desulfobacterales bacterium]|nr:glyoxalase [Desulfobacterales bacterium]